MRFLKVILINEAEHFALHVGMKRVTRLHRQDRNLYAVFALN